MFPIFCPPCELLPPSQALCTCSWCILWHPSSRAKFRANCFNLTQPDSKLVLTIEDPQPQSTQRFHCSSPRTWIKIRVEWFASFGSHFDPICVHFGPEESKLVQRFFWCLQVLQAVRDFLLDGYSGLQAKVFHFFPCFFLHVFLNVFLRSQRKVFNRVVSCRLIFESFVRWWSSCSSWLLRTNRNSGMIWNGSHCTLHFM